MIIARDPLTETLPVMPTPDEPLLTTQYDCHYVESVGLLKMDFLGLKTLTVEKECVALLKERRGIDLDIERIPIDDKATYELFGRGETTGLFQFESNGMKNYLQQLQANRFEELVAMNALYRPGPLEKIPSFIARKYGREPVSYDHPLMEEILKETYGVTVYQEQVMLLSRTLGGFTRGDSDNLRKAMGKKDPERMKKLFTKFENGCLSNPKFREAPCAATEADARALIAKIWKDWSEFAKYAFNKSHAVCYAWVAYQTGYLKAHYPVEFMCAQISSELGGDPKKFAAMLVEVMLEDEFRLTGMYLTGHPLARWRQLFASRVNITIQEIATLAKKLESDERRPVKMLGMVSSVRVMSGGGNTKNGKRSKDWSVIKFADETGEMEACAFSRCHDRISGWIGDAEGVPVLMEGTVSSNHAEGEEATRIRFALDAVTPLDGRVPLDGKLAVEMAYEDEQLVERTIELCKVLKRHSGRTPVCINLKYPTGAIVTIALADRVTITDELLEELEIVISTTGSSCKGCNFTLQGSN